MITDAEEMARALVASVVEDDSGLQDARVQKLADLIRKHRHPAIHVWRTWGGRHRYYKDGRVLLGYTNPTRRGARGYSLWAQVWERADDG